MSEINPFFDDFINDEFFTLLSQNMEKITPQMTTDQFCHDCNHKECTKKPPETIGRFEDPKFPPFTYYFNNYGFRSNDFDPDTAKENFLFAGCSNTFGIGLPIEFTWSHQFNSLFNKTNFFSLGVNSASIDAIIHNINVYINKIGIPKGIVILFPDLWRFLTRVDFSTEEHGKFSQWSNIGRNGIKNQIIGEHPKQEMNFVYSMFETNSVLRAYHGLYALELLCKKLNIPLLWSTWSSEFNKYADAVLNEKLNCYGNLLNEVNFTDYKKFEKVQKENKSIYWTQNREVHPNGAQHLMWAEGLYRLWNKKYPDFEK